MPKTHEMTMESGPELKVHAGDCPCGCEDEASFEIRGSCDCGAWFKVFVGVDTKEMVMFHNGAVAFNDYPPCPAVWLANRQLEEELRGVGAKR